MVVVMFTQAGNYCWIFSGNKRKNPLKPKKVWSLERLRCTACVCLERTGHPVRKTKSSCGRMFSPQQVPARKEKGSFSCETKTAACDMIDITESKFNKRLIIQENANTMVLLVHSRWLLAGYLVTWTQLVLLEGFVWVFTHVQSM